MSDRFVVRPGGRPCASAYVRWQAALGQTVLTNLRHETVNCEESDARRVLMLLDGSRRQEEIGDAEQIGKLARFALLQA